MSLKQKLLKNSTLKHTALLSDSILFSEKEMIPTQVPLMNVALAASPTGGMLPGLFQITGPSKHFKSAFSLLMASSFIDKFPEGMILFYDSEFGTPESYFDSFKLPKDQIIHSPITNVEEFKHDIMTQLEGIERGDKVMIIVDSIGNLASKKEVEDALEGKSVADMTRAKAFKSLGRMITPHLTLKNIPMIAINHVYQTLEMFSKTVVGGGTGFYLSSDEIWIIGRQQDKDKTEGELNGYHFIINVEKSRHVKEKSKFPITVSFDGGIQKYSGMLELGLETGFVTEGKKGFFEYKGKQFSKKKALECRDIWDAMLKDQKVIDYIKAEYMVGHTSIMKDMNTDKAEVE